MNSEEESPVDGAASPGPGECLCVEERQVPLPKLVSGLIIRGTTCHTTTHPNVNAAVLSLAFTYAHVRTGMVMNGQRPLAEGGRRGQV